MAVVVVAGGQAQHRQHHLLEVIPRLVHSQERAVVLGLVHRMMVRLVVVGAVGISILLVVKVDLVVDPQVILSRKLARGEHPN